MEVFLDKEKYDTGEMARLAISSPFPEAKALITLEGSHVLQSDVIDIVGNAAVYEFPVTPDMQPNISVAVFLVEKNAAIPRFKLGYQNLDISLRDREMQVIVTPIKEEYQYGEQVQVRIETRDADGNPVPAELSVAVVDEALVRMAGQVNTSFLPHIFQRRYLTLVSSTNLLAFLHDSYFSSFGGAGKGGRMENFVEVRKDFDEVLHWAPTVQTDTNGQAILSFGSGDTITSYIILAAGASTDTVTKFGAAEGRMSIRKELVMKTDFPRFFREGDDAEITAFVSNTGKIGKNIRIAFEVESLETRDVQKSVYIGPGETSRVTFAVHVPEGSAQQVSTLRLIARGDMQASDAVEVMIPIKATGTERTSPTSMILPPGKTTVDLTTFDRLDLLTWSVSASFLVDLEQRTEKLLKYPYGCAEQTISSTMPNAIVAALLSELGRNTSSAEANVAAGLKRLERFQKADGSFSLWEGGSSSDYVTAIVAEGLATMSDAGSPPPEEMQHALSRYYGRTFHVEVGAEDTVERATKIRLLYATALSTLDAELVDSHLTAFLEQWEDLGPFEKVDLVLAISRTDFPLSVTQKEQLRSDLEVLPDFNDIAYEERRHYRFDREGSYRARHFRALLSLDPERADAEARLAELLNVPNNNYYYFSSYDEAQKMLAAYALSQYLPSAEGALLEMLLGEQSEQVTVQKAIQEGRWEDPAEDILTLEQEATEPIYLTLGLTGKRQLGNMSEANRGMEVTRKIYRENGEEVKAGESLHLGQLYTVELEYSKDPHVEDLALSSPSPAGVEIVTDYQKNLWDGDFYYIEHRDDRVDAFPRDHRLSGDYRYTIRPVATGEYAFPPATIVGMYDPEYFASTAGGTIRIEP